MNCAPVFNRKCPWAVFFFLLSLGFFAAAPVGAAAQNGLAPIYNRDGSEGFGAVDSPGFVPAQRPLQFAAAEKDGKEKNDSASAEAASDADLQPDSGAEEAEEEHSLLHKTVLYLPNRIFDLFDLVRARVRVGPGIAAGVRVTKVVQLYLGASETFYAGLPGPRQESTVPLPIGIELNNQASLSILSVSADAGLGPDYSPTEIGAGFQLLILGAEVGFDPVELVDLIAGLGGFDLRDDDF